MKLYFIKTPNWLKRLFSKQIWCFDTTEEILYLTFDDGPTPEITTWVLDQLKQYNAQATFFCIGNNIQKHPELFQTIQTAGHAVGNHTYNHDNGWKTGTTSYLSSIAKTKKLTQSNLFRPPYGKIKPIQTNKLIALGYKIIMWDVLSADFDTTITPSNCLENVLKNTAKGSIIVFHDSIKARENLKYTLPKVLAYFSKRGWRFECID